MKRVSSLVCVFFLAVSLLHENVVGVDLAERFLFRAVCYNRDQPGCTKDLIEVYKNVSRSANGATKADTFLFLSTPENKDNPENIDKCAGDLPPNSKFRKDCPVVILFPGFVSGICTFGIYRELKNEFLKKCFNVIQVEWTWGNGPDLYESKQNIRIVAQQIAIVINNLKKNHGVKAENIRCVGHSYGAHGCGFVGQFTHIGEIVGLDPAGVLFTENTPLDERLDKSDADCVQVLHCNGGQCLPKYFGVNFTCGHTDIWINGGLHQPACIITLIESLLKGDYIYGLLHLYPAACSHFQCLEYYKATLNTDKCQFTGVKCESKMDFDRKKCRSCGTNGENCVIVGGDSCKCTPKEGNYYLKTRLLCPYCDNIGIRTGGFSCNANATTDGNSKKRPWTLG